MKIKLLFTGLCLCSLSYVGYGQSQTHALKEPVPVVVSSNPDLNAHRSRVDSKQAEVNQAVSVSRTQSNKLNDELRVLKEEYVRLLSAAMDKTADTSMRAQLQEEITRYATVTHSQTR